MNLISLFYLFSVHYIDIEAIEGKPYTINIIRLKNDTTIDINVTLTKDKTVVGDGIKELKHDLNTFIIEISAEDGSKEIYTLYVDALYNDIKIIEVFLNDNTIKVLKDVFEYTFRTPYLLNKINFKTFHNEFAELMIVSKSRSLDKLEKGLNVFIVYVTSEYGTKGNEYTLKIYNNVPVIDENLSNSSLVDLSVIDFEISPEFIYDNYSYRVKVNRKDIKLDYKKTHKDQTVVVSDSINNLQVGENIVKVTSVDGIKTSE